MEVPPDVAVIMITIGTIIGMGGIYLMILDSTVGDPRFLHRIKWALPFSAMSGVIWGLNGWGWGLAIVWFLAATGMLYAIFSEIDHIRGRAQ